MSIIVDNIPGPTANSFVSLEEADAYMQTHLQADTWSALDEEVRKRAIISATRQLDNFQFGGRKSTAAQSLSWPRTSVSDFDGYTVSGIPSKLKSATVELAIWNLSESDRIADNFALESFSTVNIGPISYSVKDGAGSALPSSVASLLASIGPIVLVSLKPGKTSAKVMVL